MKPETVEWLESLPKPGDKEGWNKRAGEIFGEVTRPTDVLPWDGEADDDEHDAGDMER